MALPLPNPRQTKPVKSCYFVLSLAVDKVTLSRGGLLLDLYKTWGFKGSAPAVQHMGAAQAKEGLSCLLKGARNS